MSGAPSENVQLLVCAGALALLCAVVIVALVFIAKSLRSVATETRRIHLQQATIVGMLLRAGFRPHKGGKDWFDDGKRTRVAGELDLTQFDWRHPSE